MNHHKKPWTPEGRSSQEIGRASARSWAVAKDLSETLGGTATEQRSWVKHYREAGLDIKALREGNPEEVEKAKKVMADLGKPLKVPNVGPVQRSATKCLKALANPSDDVATGTLRNRVQIMLWAIGKCGTAKLAEDAFRRAMIAIGEEEPSEGDPM